MPRKVELGRGIVVIPYALVAAAEREVDASDPTVLVIYPDDATAADVAEIVKQTAALARVKASMDAAPKETGP